MVHTSGKLETQSSKMAVTKLSLRERKRNWYYLKQEMGLVQTYTNRISYLFNLAWSKSFASVRNKQKAILDRGWYPANYRLLTDTDIMKTKPVTVSPSSSDTPAI